MFDLNIKLKNIKDSFFHKCYLTKNQLFYSIFLIIIIILKFIINFNVFKLTLMMLIFMCFEYMITSEKSLIKFFIQKELIEFISNTIKAFLIFCSLIYLLITYSEKEKNHRKITQITPRKKIKKYNFSSSNIKSIVNKATKENIKDISKILSNIKKNRNTI